MKTTKPIYIFTGPVTALVIILLLAGNIYCYLRWQWKKADYNALLDGTTPAQLYGIRPVFQTDDRAVFDFTGDTVLILSPAHPINRRPAWNVLYKDRYGIYQTEDLTEAMLDKVETAEDTTSYNPPKDKLSRYKAARSLL